MTSVGVAIYNPADERDPCHWALWLQSADRQSVLLQVGDDKGGRGYYLEEPIFKEPMRSIRLKEIVPCGTIPTNRHNQVVSVIQSNPVDNQSSTWNCQAWVMENLNNLENLRLLQLTPETKAKLESKRQNWQ
jgi:hypothetical protein